MSERHDYENAVAPRTSEAKFYQVFRIQDGWMALAKAEPFTDFYDALRESGKLWYAFGDSRAEALSRLELSPVS